MESYQRLLDVIALENLHMQAEHWLLTVVLVPQMLFQIAVVAGALVLARLLVHLGGLRIARFGPERNALRIALHNAQAFAGTPVYALILITMVIVVAGALRLPIALLSTVAQLLLAWIVIRLLSLVIRSGTLSRAAFFTAFAIAALSITGLLEPVIVHLDRIGFRVGTIHLSVLDMLRTVVQLALFIWAALAIARLLEGRVQNTKSMAPSLRVLTGKLLRMTLLTIAVLFGLANAGIDLTAFALVTGALGVALGFGMQKTVSNLISGLLLLVDRSIKPGDVLELTDPSNRTVQLFGWVTALNARYVSLTTRDGTEWLVPNDELISTRIVNWSYSHNKLRLLTPIAISFECDVKLAMKIATDAALSTSRVLRDPAPVCRLMSFGDSCVNLELRFWIDDPANGIINVRSEVLVAVWEKFREFDIRTRLGHRDIHIKSDSGLTVRMERPPEE